jgi:hypothetical protein
MMTHSFVAGGRRDQIEWVSPKAALVEPCEEG